MEIVYAAEGPSIAQMLGDFIKRRVTPEEIEVSENPDEMGSFFIGFKRSLFVLSPDGHIEYERQ